MWDWVFILILSVIGLIAFLKVIGYAWFAFEMWDKWRTVPELWSLDWLDITYRIEHRFGVHLTGRDFDSWPPDARKRLTAGQLWYLIMDRLRATGAEISADSWQRLGELLCESLNVRRERIRPGAQLYGELGMRYLIE